MYIVYWEIIDYIFLREDILKLFVENGVLNLVLVSLNKLIFYL